MAIHKRITALRKRANLTQQQVADGIGITRGAYANYELGKREPDAHTFALLADLFNVSTDYLIKGEHAESNVINVGEFDEETIRNFEIFLSDVDALSIDVLINKYAVRLDGRLIERGEWEGAIAWIRAHRIGI